MEEEPAKSREDPPGDVSVNDDDDSSQDGGAAESVKMNPSEQENSAAEGLLGLLDTGYNKKTTRVPVLNNQTTRVKTYHLSAKRVGDEFFTEGGLVNENSNEGGFLFIMSLKIYNFCQHVFSANINL